MAPTVSGRLSYVLFPGVGGHVFPFQPLARYLATQRGGVGLIDPGFLDDESHPDSIAGYAERMLDDLRMAVPQGPYLLAGYSMGALVALEVARRLRDDGQSVAILVIDGVLPGGLRKKSWPRRLLVKLMDTSTPGYPFSIFGPFVSTRLRRWRNRRVARDASPPTRMSERLRYVQARARTARDRYSPSPCPVPTILLRAADLPGRYERPDDYGWGQYVELLSVVDTAGGHSDIYKGQNIESLADAAARAFDSLERVLSGQSSPTG